ncbi:unnamed protein product [Paramecium octaurelia]|uniref:Phosphoglycerate mutase n=1 Tax=Paramecium octaurelia TaxID=43137 RepID=A0A8S1YPX0_PAROT|nr:unnamed protein product [Paramecium octaurelia]
MIRIFLIRHGQSLYQSLKIVSGMNEYGLSGLGKVQSKNIGRKLSSIRFDYVYSSDFKRCIESYELIENELKHKPSNVIYTPILRERDPGNDLLKSYSEVYPLQSQTIVDRENNAETSEEIQIRAQAFFNQLITQQLYQQSFQNLPLDSLNKMILSSQVAEPHYSHHIMRSYIHQAQQFSSSQKSTGCTNILAISHAGFITEAIQFLYKHQNIKNTDGLQPAVYARNGALFLLEIEAQNLDDWKCNIYLRNYSKSIDAPFESII